MSKAQGRMDELREFMAKHFSEIGDRPKFLKIQFMQAADRITADSYEKFKSECTSAE
jgi:hypothetical protein